jgi:C4-type Zn-finger protein
METECIEVSNSIELSESEKKTKRASVTVLIMDGVTVAKDAKSYTVSGGEVKNRVSYLSTFEGAMQEVSDRLFLNKLTKRAEEGRTDFESLVKLVEEHKNEMKGKFKL